MHTRAATHEDGGKLLVLLLLATSPGTFVAG